MRLNDNGKKEWLKAKNSNLTHAWPGKALSLSLLEHTGRLVENKDLLVFSSALD
jgi:hypothetical protein